MKKDLKVRNLIKTLKVGIGILIDVVEIIGIIILFLFWVFITIGFLYYGFHLLTTFEFPAPITNVIFGIIFIFVGLGSIGGMIALFRGENPTPII